jgi:1-aminocyclopropane-1-carboxylate deaminase/D-cysteine desulfhydrase-like pyridoxal-dependent ACC family enzyme
MAPGGVSPRGCLGFVSGALELQAQVAAGLLPPPREVIIAVGSTCSTAGLLLGLCIAARLSGERPPPRVVAVRVTPWPVTSPLRIVALARRTAAWLARLTGDRVFDVSFARLAAGLQVDASQLGPGYGRPTPTGAEAAEQLRPLVLDGTYSEKSAAALLERVRADPQVPRVYWATKSSAPLPPPAPLPPDAPRAMLRWLQRRGPPAPWLR